MHRRARVLWIGFLCLCLAGVAGSAVGADSCEQAERPNSTAATLNTFSCRLNAVILTVLIVLAPPGVISQVGLAILVVWIRDAIFVGCGRRLTSRQRKVYAN